ncbi:hypothetical protein QN277_000747 [Acacia crassicarpa]|uniref:CCHC-type domain-containing protein n=1 Tax=Acacia crassicarpa TaxID=499986 RepID=A0AAE1N749_9FABA|nr:hypothetical protein QN277_000747 [Acacia crassicarpa]
MEEDDLFTNEKDISWKIPEPTDEMRKLMELYPVAPCTEEEYNEWCEPWNYALILTVLGRKFNLYVLKDLLTNIWGFSNFELINIPNNYFVVRFQDQDLWRSQYKKVLYEGPWVIKQHCVIVRRWTPYFNPYKNALGRVATWVRIPDVPMHLYNKHYISRLGDQIGRTLKVDMNTLQDYQTDSPKIQRGKFVRICVELNLQKKLVPKVIVAGSIFNVEYEGLTLICFDCGRFGHRRENCPHRCSPSDQQEAHSQPLQQPPQVVSVNTSATGSEEAFGPWMLVNRRNRRNRPVQWPESKLQQQPSGPGPRSVKPTVIAQKSRYAPIEDPQNQDDVTVSHSVRQSTVPRLEQAVIRKDTSVKPSTMEKKRITAGKMGNKGIEIIQKKRNQYRPKTLQPNGPATSIGPNTTVEEDQPNGPSIMDDRIVSIKGIGAANGPNHTMDSPTSSTLLGHPNQDTPPCTNDPAALVGHKKPNGRKTKSQRIHNVVHGQMDNVNNQKIHWDPNEDVAPDFLEAKGSFVAETQHEHHHVDDAQCSG